MWSSISSKRKTAPAASLSKTAPGSSSSRNPVAAQHLHRLPQVARSVSGVAYEDEWQGSTIKTTQFLRSRWHFALFADEFTGTTIGSPFVAHRNRASEGGNQ